MLKKIFYFVLFFIGALLLLASCGEEKTSESSKPTQSTKAGASSEASSNNTSAPAPVQVTEKLKFPLKVRDIGLGQTKAPCKPQEATYVDILQKPVRVQMQCTVGDRKDRVLVVFSIDGKSVVRVTRNQYLMPSDPEPRSVVNAAVAFYGTPTNYDEENWLANYGNAFSISYNGRRASTSMNNNGIGLLINGLSCGDGRFGTEDCGNLGTRVIKYDLVDVDGFRKQIEDGKAAQQAKQQSQISNQRF